MGVRWVVITIAIAIAIASIIYWTALLRSHTMPLPLSVFFLRHTHTDALETTTRYLTCNRTEDDEHSQFVRFQLLCLILGSFSFLWVRRYRVIYASLFEQRKLSRISRRPSDGDLELGDNNNNNNNSSSSNTSGNNAIEMTRREEMAPLTNNSNLEVI